MNIESFDCLTQLFTQIGNRRSAMGMLIGATLLGTALDRAAAKPESLRDGKTRGTGTRRGKKKRKGHRRARAQGKSKPGNHCISPTGRDLNDLYGITAQIVNPSRLGFVGCDKVGAGEQWTHTHGWAVEHTFVRVPAGFTSEWDTPLEDFLAKFTGVRYVIDPGTKHERSLAIPTSDKLFIFEDQGLVSINPGTLGTVHPLSVGEHVFDQYWEFSAMHCDGIGDDLTPGVNCFPAGETKYTAGLAFTVVPGHN